MSATEHHHGGPIHHPAPSISGSAPPEEMAPGVKTEILDDVRAVAHTANEMLNGLADASGITPHVEQHPYGLLAAALGSGYVVGGGLFTATTARLIGMTLKLAAIPAVRMRLLDVAESALDSFLAPHAVPSPPTAEKKS